MQQVPNVLLLTRTPPGSGSVGEIVLRDQLLLYPRGKVSCFVVESREFGALSPELNWLPITFFGRVSRSALRTRVAFLDGFFSFVKHQYHRHITALRIIRKAVAFARKHGAEVVWVNLNAPIMVYVAKKIADSLGVQLLTMVWDPPERFMPQMDAISGRLLLKDFAEALRASSRCAVISEKMRDVYREKYGVEAVVVRHGLDQAAQYPPAADLVADGEFVLGFAGSQYAHEEWHALLVALDRASWRVNSRKVVIRLLGSRCDMKTKGPMNIEFLGWRSVSDAVELLSQMDALYLPYMFDEKDSVRVNLSFPTKLTTYLSAGRPVFFHGPRDSAPARFLQEYPAGYCCHSLLPDDIIECLTRFTRDDGGYRQMTAAGKVAFEREFTLDVFRSRFAEFLGVKPSDLLNLRAGAAE